MSISEDLQTRLSGLTQGPNPAPRRISNREMELMRETNPMAGRLGSPGQGFYADDVGMQMQAPTSENPAADAISFVSGLIEKSNDPEEREGLASMIEKLQVQSMAPMGEMAQQLAQAGGGEDTALAHLRPGEIVLPPEMMEDPEFESMVENKFNQLGINPEEAVVGMGIASLNESTGLEQFGFFKKIGKKLGKVVKKVAPIAAFIPGVGTALGGALGGLGGLATKGLAKVGLGGLGSALGSAGTALASGISSLGIPGVSSIAGGTAGGFGGISNALTTKAGLFGDGPLSGLFGGGQETASFDLKTSQLDPKTNMFVDAAGNSVDPATYRKYISDPSSIPMTGGGGNFNLGRALTGGAGRTPDFIKAGEDMLKGQYTPGTSRGGGGFGGLGDLAKIGGIGALAAGLGKLAYEDTKNQKGVSLSPVVAMDATGRYNLEAEMARRMGQQAPNPVEFGLLPEGTIPELSGGKPKGMMYGGSVMPMAYADGGNVAMEDFERKNGFIDGPGTETSDDIPAMLSDGEFVMTGQAVRGAGSYDMNNNQGILTLTPNGGPDRDNGTELMYQLMEAFSGQARPA